MQRMARIVFVLIFIPGAVLASLQAWAQYPARPVRVVVPASPGGASDLIVVENRARQECFPPISLPKRENMERAREICGYSLGEWSEALDEEAQAAVRGDYFEYGKKRVARRRKDIGMNTEVRSLGHDKDESDE